MAFVTFNVKQPHASSLSDGLVDFTWGFDSYTPPNLINATLTYKVNEHAPVVRTIFQNQSASRQLDGRYDLGPFDFGPTNKVVIPASPPFPGGSYQKLVNVVFTPSSASPGSSGTISGTFQNPVPDSITDPKCD